MPRSTESRLRAALTLGGGALIALAVLARPLGLDSQPGAGTGEVLLASLGGGCVLVAVLWRRTGAVYRWCAVTLVSTAILLGLAELAARGVSTLAERRGDVTLASLPAYADRPWARTYWREHALSSRKRYVPYVGWRRLPFAGETITVDGDGHRATPGARCTADALTVFVFGGSTVWGWGSPDDLTMPARLQALLARERPGDVCVVNFGEDAHVATQHAVELVLELRAGRVPDAVILSVGVNDVEAAAENGRAGDPRYAARFAARLAGERAGVADLVEGSALVGLTRRLRRAAPDGEGLRLGDVDPARLADDVVATVEGTARVVGALGERFGFATVVVWHPAPFAGDKPLTDDERAALEAVDPGLRRLYAAVYDGAARRARAGAPFTLATDTFDGETGRIYLDRVHVLPEGNELYAAAVAALLPGE